MSNWAVIFFETKLSGDNSMSCASCHAPNRSFSDSNQFSVGIDGVYGSRNSMALINLGGMISLHGMVVHPL